MSRIPVNSRNLKSVGYDSSTSTLEVEFIIGGVYQYSRVPETHYFGLIQAPSHGKYFDANIKRGGFAYRKIK